MNFNSPPNSPINAAKRWFDHAQANSGSPNPLKMAVSTVDRHGCPSSRMLLLKGFDRNGACFFTNYESDKAIDIEHNTTVCLLFHWDEMQRQLRIQGSAQKMSDEESDVYFATRDRLSQIGAIASAQSQSLSSRSVLIEQVESLSVQWEGKPIPRPENWGGYRVSLDSIEFWQGQEGRLHDRIRYFNSGGWSWERLQP